MGTLGEKVRALREARGWSLQELAAHGILVGRALTPAVVRRIEAGEGCHARTLGAIAAAFGMPLEEMVAGVDLGRPPRKRPRRRR